MTNFLNYTQYYHDTLKEAMQGLFSEWDHVVCCECWLMAMSISVILATIEYKYLNEEHTSGPFFFPYSRPKSVK